MDHLPYEVTQELALPAEAFDQNGMAVLAITGGSYGGTWVLNAISTHLPPSEAEPAGQIETDEAPRQPERPLTAARHWLTAYCAANGCELAHFEPLNHTYSPDEAPFFSSAQAVIRRTT